MSGSGQILITRQLEILAIFFQKLSYGDLATDQSFHLVDGGALLKSSTLSSPICPSQQSSNSSINISRRKLSKLGTQVTFRYQYCHAQCIPDIFQFWYTATRFEPVKRAQICDKIAKMGQNRPKVRILFAKKGTGLKKDTTAGSAVVTNISYVAMQQPFLELYTEA